MPNMSTRKRDGDIAVAGYSRGSKNERVLEKRSASRRVTRLVSPVERKRETG